MLQLGLSSETGLDAKTCTGAYTDFSLYVDVTESTSNQGESPPAFGYGFFTYNEGTIRQCTDSEKNDAPAGMMSLSMSSGGPSTSYRAPGCCEDTTYLSSDGTVKPADFALTGTGAAISASLSTTASISGQKVVKGEITDVAASNVVVDVTTACAGTATTDTDTNMK